MNLADNLKRACIKWHLENKIKSKSNEITKQDLTHATDNKIRSFVKWETGLLLLSDKPENLPLQVDGDAKKNDSNFCNMLLSQA